MSLFDPSDPLEALKRAIAELELFALRTRGAHFRGQATDMQARIAFDLLRQARQARSVYLGLASGENVVLLSPRRQRASIKTKEGVL